MLYLMTIGKYLLPLITLPYLTRVLTPSYYGIVTYLTSTMTYFQVFVDFGFLYSSTRDASIYRNDRKKLSEILSSTVASRLILCAVGLAVLFIVFRFVKILRENPLLTFLYYLSVAVTVLLPDYIYRGIEKMEIVSLRFIIARLVSTVLTFIFIKSSDDILYLPVLTIFGNLAAVFFSYMHLYKVQKVKLVKVSSHQVFMTLKDSSMFFLATFATTAFGATTTFLMGISKLSTSDIAYWGLAYQIVCTIEMLYDPIISSIYPHMVDQKDYGLIKKTLIIIMPVIFLGLVLCFLLAGFVIQIAGGAEYEAAVPVFRILLPMLFFSFPAQILGFPLLAPSGNEKYASRSTVISAVYHVLGLFLLLLTGKFTLVNIAVLRVTTNVVLLLCRVVIAKKLFSVSKG